jgi:hypothetical protein
MLSQMAGLLRLIWFDFTDVIWRNRNEIAHERENNARQVENTTWANKLLWYLENMHVIARRDQFIINYTEEDIETIPGLVRRKMVQTYYYFLFLTCDTTESINVETAGRLTDRMTSTVVLLVIGVPSLCPAYSLGTGGAILERR